MACTHENDWDMARAAESGNITVIRGLVKSPFSASNSAMSLAAKYGHCEIVELLLNCGADRTSEALRVATCCGHTDIAWLLVSRMNNYDQMMCMIEFLKELGYDLKMKLP